MIFMDYSHCRVITIGKIKKDWIKNGINLYKKRLPKLNFKTIRDSSLKKEAADILMSLKNNEYLVTLCEEGECFDSRLFAEHISKLGKTPIAFVIGGSNGLSSEIKSKAQLQLSLSKLTFPHEIASLLLVEQLSRTLTIIKGSPYHCE